MTHPRLNLLRSAVLALALTAPLPWLAPALAAGDAAALSGPAVDWRMAASDRSEEHV